ncbi:hypothetical protein ACP4OV_021712 [Aristida adscensionis]
MDGSICVQAESRLGIIIDGGSRGGGGGDGGEETTKVQAAAMVEEKKMACPWEGVMLPASMVLVQCFTIGALLLSKIALNVGMEPFVLLAYRNLIGAITVAPFAFYFEREMGRKVNLKVCGWISINALFGIVLAMGLNYYGLRATNAAYSVNFLNVIPVVTFVIAAALRVEKLAAGTAAGQMKLVGTAICVGGTMVVSLYKGRPLHLWPTHLLRPHAAAAVPTPAAAAHQDMAAGTLYLCGSCLAYAVWFIVQARVARVFPSKYFSTMLGCVSGTAQAMAIGAVIHQDRPAAWLLAWDLQLVTVVYSGVFNTGVTFCLISWAIARRGPIYPSMFNSLSLVATTVLDSLLLGTTVSVGSLLGAMLIVVGLYAFLWGKGKEIAHHRQPAATNGTGTGTGTAADRRNNNGATANGDESV